MHAITVSLFGRFRIYDTQQGVIGFELKRAQELLAYLLLHRDRPYPRETLASLLWEDAEPIQARKYLRQALWRIKTMLQNVLGKDATKLLTLEAEWVQLNSSDCLSLDVAHLERAINLCQGVEGVDLSDAWRGQLEHAVDFYRADLLEGWYQGWCLLERERLQNCYLMLLDKLVACYAARGWVDGGLAYAQRVLQCDPAEERTHYYMMRLHWLAGRRTRAMRQYKYCEKILLTELGVQPSGRTKKLYDEIRADKLTRLDDRKPTLEPNTSQPVLETLTGLMTYFEQLQAQLVHLEEQLKRDSRPWR